MDILLKLLYILPKAFLALKTILNLLDSGPNNKPPVGLILELFKSLQNYALHYSYSITYINAGNYKNNKLYYYLL
jgi:hypothetical protein